MVKEHDRVVLRTDVPADNLLAGDVGTVVHVYAGHKAFEVEFVSLNGRTVVVTTVSASKVRAVRSNEIAHARPLAVA